MIILLELQMNSAHLEKCLHEAREEAQKHLCTVDRRASEYNTLRKSAIKTSGLFERLRNCVSSVEEAAFVDSLHALAQSLSRFAFRVERHAYNLNASPSLSLHGF